MASDILTTLASWLSTSSLNQPQGSTSVSTNLDDGLREIQGVIVRGLSHKGTDIASAATTDLGAIEGLAHDITGVTTITSFGTVRAGIWKCLKFEGALTLTHNATSLIIPGGANVTTANGDMCMVTSEGSGNWRMNWFQRANGKALVETAAPATDGEYRSTQVFTASGTYTAPAGLVRAKVRLVGGGGGSGGCAATSSNQGAGAGGGGGGGYAERLLTAAQIGASQTVTIGAGGTAAAAGNNVGGTGGTTTFGALLSATGGGGGGGGVNTTVQLTIGGGPGGVGSTGDVNIKGQGGGFGIGLAASSQGAGGPGGSSVLGGGAESVVTVGTLPGQPGGNYGGGASGSANGQTQAATPGAAGAPGIVIVEEFF